MTRTGDPAYLSSNLANLAITGAGRLSDHAIRTVVGMPTMLGLGTGSNGSCTATSDPAQSISDPAQSLSASGLGTGSHGSCTATSDPAQSISDPAQPISASGLSTGSHGSRTATSDPAQSISDPAQPISASGLSTGSHGSRTATSDPAQSISASGLSTGSHGSCTATSAISEELQIFSKNLSFTQNVSHSRFLSGRRQRMVGGLRTMRAPPRRPAVSPRWARLGRFRLRPRARCGWRLRGGGRSVCPD